MASLPRAVQQQIEAADALLGELTKPEPTEAPQASLEEIASLADQPPAEAPATTPPPAQTPVAPPPPAPAPPSQSDETWERRYKSLQGLFNAEMPKLQQANKDLSRQLQEAIARLESVEKPATQPQAKQPEPLSDPKDADVFGADLVEMVTRIVTRAVGGVAQKVEATVATYETRLKQIEQALAGTTQTVAATAEEQFFDRLAKLVPDWEQINADPEFLAWLAEVDPVYGQPRQAALTSAQQALNAQRAAAVFLAFKPSAPVAAPAAPPVDTQVSPRARSAAPAAPQEKPIITQAQVAKFYRDVSAGLYRGRDADVARMEAVINSAIAEGRVR